MKDAVDLYRNDHAAREGLLEWRRRQVQEATRIVRSVRYRRMFIRARINAGKIRHYRAARWRAAARILRHWRPV